MTLTEFLLARIAEDEALARAAAEDEHLLRSLRSITSAPIPGGEILHIVRWAPARVLAECEAKRQIVGIHRDAQAARSVVIAADDGTVEAAGVIGIVDSCLATAEGCMKLHAEVYADHPDYQQEWKPERYP